jgi:hypothetical protein
MRKVQIPVPSFIHYHPYIHPSFVVQTGGQLGQAGYVNCSIVSFFGEISSKFNKRFFMEKRKEKKTHHIRQISRGK